MRVWNLDPCSDQCPDIEVYIPGPPGPPLTDVGTFLAPVNVSAGTIAAPVSRNQRSFIKATSAPVNQPVIPNPADNGPWMLILQVVGSNAITINNASNIKLSGQWIGSPDSIITLLWDGNSRYVEVNRNEI